MPLNSILDKRLHCFLAACLCSCPLKHIAHIVNIFQRGQDHPIAGLTTVHKVTVLLYEVSTLNFGFNLTFHMARCALQKKEGLYKDCFPR